MFGPQNLVLPTLLMSEDHEKKLKFGKTAKLVTVAVVSMTSSLVKQILIWTSGSRLNRARNPTLPCTPKRLASLIRTGYTENVTLRFAIISQQKPFNHVKGTQRF